MSADSNSFVHLYLSVHNSASRFHGVLLAGMGRGDTLVHLDPLPHDRMLQSAESEHQNDSLHAPPYGGLSHRRSHVQYGASPRGRIVDEIYDLLYRRIASHMGRQNQHLRHALPAPHGDDLSAAGPLLFGRLLVVILPAPLRLFAVSTISRGAE